ncbi:MAG: hydantoinase B/oxoprolinase family protein [Proteobacteria bacterium]|nr:hydantoinase B/oxoprolinase family protein [Pseudomonadota bacterium]
MTTETKTAPGSADARVDPIILQIVEESLNSIEREVEAAIERTSRSPMIRDQHDYRVGIHDRRCRKLTGRSYSAMVDPVVRDFPIETMQPGDVFFFNDVYLSEGSIGHLPDLCTTVPVFHKGDVVAFVQAFGHHDDIGGAVPGSMPGSARTCFEEGLMIPPIRLVEAGVRNQAAYRIIVRNTRLPDSVAADIDSEIAACQMGAERIDALFERFGRDTMEQCFQAILDRCRDNFLREIFPKIKNGTYTWEDYVEHDGVSEPRLHALRLTMTKNDDKIVLDFRGTDDQSPGPINWPADYAGGKFLIKWVTPVLRSLADTPERAAELHVNEGICDLFEVIFPDKGTLISPQFPAATNARSFVLLRSMGLLAGVVAHAVSGARMPADQETIRYWGLHGHDQEGHFFLWREVLGGGSGGRYYADGSDAIHIVPDSRNQPAEFAETRFPVIIEKLGLRRDSGGVGERRGGLGYEKDVRLLVDANLILTADRVHLGCYGVNGGSAGQPYQTVINPDSEARSLPGLVDGEPLRAGDLVRIVTTGGGGWGDPLDRDSELVRMDVVRGVVSRESALRDYGVVFAGADDPSLPVDARATEAQRAGLKAARRNAKTPDDRPGDQLIDRGPGYPDMLARTETWRRSQDRPALRSTGDNK